MNRRRPTEDGIAFSPYSDGAVNHEVPVLVATDPTETGDAAVRALLFGYACHTSSQFLYEFSGDWAAYTQQFLEERFQNATAVFLQGCAGDQKAYPQRELSYTKGHARAVALGVEAALESVLQPVRGPLRATYEEIDIAFESQLSRADLESLAESDEPAEQWKGEHLLSVLDDRGELPTTYPYPIQAFGFGTDLTMVALAGEPLVGYANRLTDELDGPAWISGYSNNAFTYVPTRQALPEGGYEAERVIHNTAVPGRWQPDVEERVVSAVHALADRVRTPGSST